jgi:hypothetical protein
VDPYLQGTNFTEAVRTITGFAARVKVGGYGRGRTVKADTVSTAIAAVGKEIALASGINPTKMKHTEKLLPRIGQMLDGWRKVDGPVMKKLLPVEVDVPEYLVKLGLAPDATELTKATGDLSLVAFYYLLRVGEYTTKGSHNESKQTVQFRMCDVVFFLRNEYGKSKQLPRNAPEEDIMNAECATLKLDNQKNGWRNVCVNQHHNGDELFSPVRGLGRRYIHIRKHMRGNWKTNLSAVFDEKGKRSDVTDKHIRQGLKLAASALEYPEFRGIPIERIDMHSLRIGGANALHLAGYTDREIQKMGRWRGETFKEYDCSIFGRDKLCLPAVEFRMTAR